MLTRYMHVHSKQVVEQFGIPHLFDLPIRPTVSNMWLLFPIIITDAKKLVNLESSINSASHTSFIHSSRV